MSYIEQAKKMKSRLNAVSPCFCLAKWYQGTLLLQNGFTQSCHHVKAHKIPKAGLKKNPELLYNTKYKQKMRRNMLAGNRPKECQYCWNVEDLGRLSDRHYKSSEVWAAPFFNQAALNSEKWVFPKYLEIAFENTCNFKCSYCTPQSSSRWFAEIKKYGPYLKSYQSLFSYKLTRQTPLAPHGNPYLDAFWKWWPKLRSQLNVFRITGGEPLLSAHTWRIIDDLARNPQPQLHLAINSNMGASPALINRFVQRINGLEGKIASFVLYASIDTVGERAEYIRFGLDYERFKRNIESYLTGLRWNGALSYMITINALSLVGLRELLESIAEQRQRHSRLSIGIDTPYLRNPNFMSVQILPPQFCTYLEDCKVWMINQNFAPHEVARIERVLAWMGQDLDEATRRNCQKQFFEFFTQHDERRKTCFTKTFPEHAEFWEHCKRQHQSKLQSHKFSRVFRRLSILKANNLPME